MVGFALSKAAGAMTMTWDEADQMKGCTWQILQIRIVRGFDSVQPIQGFAGRDVTEVQRTLQPGKQTVRIRQADV